MVKKQADSKKMELEQNQQKMNRKQEDYEKCKKDIEPNQRELNKILEIEQNMTKLVAEQTKVKTE